MQADDTITRKYGGTGLGLAISQRLVDLMNGEMGFKSGEEAGSTFWSTLPLEESLSETTVNKASAEAGSQKKKTYKDYSNKKPVLIAEDNLVSRDLFILQLREFGLTTRLAHNGEEAVELIKTEPNSFSLILMDLHMPKMDGTTATRVIRMEEQGTDRHIPIIAITADALTGSKESCVEAGIDDFIRKPVSLQDMNRMLAKWLRDE